MSASAWSEHPLARLTAAADRPAALAAMRAIVADAARAGTLPELHLAAREAMRQGAPERWAHYPLVVAALALLRQPSHWAGQEERATPALLAALDDLATEARGLPAIQRTFLGVLEALRAYAAGDADLAFRRFAEAGAAASPLFDRLDFASPVRFIRPLPAAFASQPDRLGALAEPVGPLPAVMPPVMVSASVDPRYAAAFADGLLHGFAGTEGLGLHLHLVAPQAEAERIAAGLHLQAAAFGATLAVTTGPAASADRAFHACARFLVAPAVMARLGCSLLILDVDSRPAPGPAVVARLASAAEEDRPLARIRPRAATGYLPWRRLHAGLIFFPNGPRGRSYAAAVAAAIGQFWREDGTSLWWIDQLALEAAAILEERAGNPVLRVPQEISAAFPAMSREEKHAHLHGDRVRAAPAAASPDLRSRLVAGATLVPPGRSGPPGVPFRMAILAADGTAVPEGDFLRRGWRMGGAVPGRVTRRLAGRYAYGGILIPHIGHFLIESLSRAWFLRAHPGLPVVWQRQGGPLRARNHEILALLGIPFSEDLVLGETTAVEELLVPEQGAVMGGAFTAAQARALGVVPAGPRRPGYRVWLSRGRLSGGMARIEGEEEIEQRLRARGWSVVAPEALPLTAQLESLAGAEEVAGFMGSALHLLLLLDRVETRVSVLDRGMPRDLWRTYTEIATAKGFQQRILRVEHAVTGGEGARASIRLADPGMVAGLLGG